MYPSLLSIYLLLPVEALTFPPTSGKSFIMGADETMESELGLGELAGLTVANEADSLAYDVSSEREDGNTATATATTCNRRTHPNQ